METFTVDKSNIGHVFSKIKSILDGTKYCYTDRGDYLGQLTSKGVEKLRYALEGLEVFGIECPQAYLCGVEFDDVVKISENNQRIEIAKNGLFADIVNKAIATIFQRSNNPEIVTINIGEYDSEKISKFMRDCIVNYLEDDLFTETCEIVKWQDTKEKLEVYGQADELCRIVIEEVKNSINRVTDKDIIKLKGSAYINKLDIEDKICYNMDWGRFVTKGGDLNIEFTSMLNAEKKYTCLSDLYEEYYFTLIRKIS